jgi:2-hydroxy-3-keto-5-methylthiopentenyl-1-phosphate phosphatase
MAPIIRAVLSSLIGDGTAHNIDIIANDVEIGLGAQWNINFQVPPPQQVSSILASVASSDILIVQITGHNKSRAILPYRELESPPLLFFLGDGVSGMVSYIPKEILVYLHFSDMSAARHADVLFVKKKDDGENDLAAYCKREGIRHILFADFSQSCRLSSAERRRLRRFLLWAERNFPFVAMVTDL